MPSTRAFMSSSMRRTSGCSMIGTRGAVGSFQCVMRAPCLRSFAYSSALRYALDATRDALHADARCARRSSS